MNIRNYNDLWFSHEYVIHTMCEKNQFHERKKKLPIDAKMGPSALANAPIDRKIPSTMPFWSCFPYSEMSVVMHVTTNAVAEIKIDFMD